MMLKWSGLDMVQSYRVQLQLYSATEQLSHFAVADLCMRVRFHTDSEVTFWNFT